MSVTIFQTEIQPRRVKTIYLNVDQVLKFLNTLNWLKSPFLREPLPDDIKVVGINSPAFGLLYIYVESQTFPEFSGGGQPPELKLNWGEYNHSVPPAIPDPISPPPLEPIWPYIGDPPQGYWHWDGLRWIWMWSFVVTHGHTYSAPYNVYSSSAAGIEAIASAVIQSSDISAVS